MKYKLVNREYVSDFAYNLLLDRGVDPVHILHTTSNDLQSPLAFDNIDRGWALLKKHLDANNKILFVVDCDVDGYTSSTILWKYIKYLKPDLHLYFLIHTGKQHGLEDVESLIEESETPPALIILPDSSSNDYEYHHKLKLLGIDILVLDHHEAPAYSEDAIVINNQLSQNYVNKALTGAGVTYQFCRYIDSQLGLNYANTLTDLCALGIISDMGSMLSIENQYLVSVGLSQEKKNFFFQTLLDKQEYMCSSSVMNSINIAYNITPLINALIRVGSQSEKTSLFLSFIDGTQVVDSTKRGEKGKKEYLATQSARNCTNAKTHQNTEKEKALAQLEIDIFNSNLDQNKLLVIDLSSSDIKLRPELNGLVAMNLAAEYKRPTLVVRRNEQGFLRGSARGLNNSELKSLKDYLDSTGLFEYCAGHANAFGVSLKASNLKELIERANKDLADYDFGNDYYEVNFIRCAQNPNLSILINDLARIEATYGQENEEPLIVIESVNINKSEISIIGAKNDTVKFAKFGIEYIQFRAKKLISDLDKYSGDIQLDLVCKAGLNEYRGMVKPQLKIIDYNIREGALSF